MLSGNAFAEVIVFMLLGYFIALLFYKNRVNDVDEIGKKKKVLNKIDLASYLLAALAVLSLAFDASSFFTPVFDRQIQTISIDPFKVAAKYGFMLIAAISVGVGLARRQLTILAEQ